MKVIGITGGIGSGKSLVTRYLKEKYNAYIADTDGIAKKQMEPGGISYQGVVDFFGSHILAEDGRIDSKKLSEIVFNDSNKLKKLNELTHANVLDEVNSLMNTIRSQGVLYFVIETALMIESGYDYVCDEVWYVYSSPEVRRSRMKTNRGYSDEKIDRIFANQCKDEEFRRKFPIVIENNGDVSALYEQIDRLMK